MTTKTLLPIALAALLGLPAAAEAQSQAQATPAEPLPAVPLKLGGYFWVDSGFMQRDNTQPGLFDRDIPYMQGRLGLLAGYERSRGDWKLDAQLELLGLENEFAGQRYEAHVLNSFLRVGQESWDVQVGRFLNSEVYYRGQGIELYTPDEFGAESTLQDRLRIYHLDTNRGHQDQPGQLAVHWRPLEHLKLEVSGVYGFDARQQVFGVRPVVEAALAGFRLFAGYEWRDEPTNTDETKVSSNSQGWAARLQYELPFLVVGANYSSKRGERFNNDDELEAALSGDTTSVGGFADLFLGKHSVGLGYHHTEFTDELALRNTSTQDQLFATYLYRLPWEGFSVKGVAGFARAEVEDRQANGTWQNDLLSFRVRVAWDFH